MLTLTTPLTTTITTHHIASFFVDVENNNTNVMVTNNTEGDIEHNRQSLSFSIFDDFGNILMPSTWPENGMSGTEIYALLQQYLFGRLQDLPGENGLGVGVIT